MRRVEIVQSDEYWNTYELIDGTVMRCKLVATHAVLDEKGEHQITYRVVVDKIQAPEKAKAK